MARRVIVEFDNDTALGVSYQGHINLFKHLAENFKKFEENDPHEGRTAKHMMYWIEDHEEKEGEEVWYAIIASKVPLQFKRIMEDVVGDIELD